MRPRWRLETARGFGSGGASRGGGSPVLPARRAKDGDTAARACPCPKAPEWVVSQLIEVLSVGPCERRAPYRSNSTRRGDRSGDRGPPPCPADVQALRRGV